MVMSVRLCVCVGRGMGEGEGVYLGRDKIV